MLKCRTVNVAYGCVRPGQAVFGPVKSAEAASDTGSASQAIVADVSDSEQVQSSPFWQGASLDRVFLIQIKSFCKRKIVWLEKERLGRRLAGFEWGWGDVNGQDILIHNTFLNIEQWQDKPDQTWYCPKILLSLKSSLL